MSRSGGYKCYNSRCGSCLGKTLCTEPGDTTLSCLDRMVQDESVTRHKKLLEQIKDYLSNCEQMRYGEMVGAPWPYDHAGPLVYTEPDAILLDLAYESITDLFSRAEAAEAAQETLQRAVEEYKARAEKSEHDMKRIVNQSSYPCEYCTKRKCSSTIRKRKCFDFEWSSQKEE